jgi:hypothetical protein
MLFSLLQFIGYPAAPSHKLNILAILFFLIGSAMHTLAQVDAIARSGKSSMGSSRLAIFLARWVTVAVRTAWCLAIFVLWLQGQLADVLRAIKVPLPDSLTGIIDLHVGAAIAFLAGYCFDSVLGYLPALQTSLPPPIDPPPPPSMSMMGGSGSAAVHP